jgi:hypothetical protein
LAGPASSGMFWYKEKGNTFITLKLQAVTFTNNTQLSNI